MIIATSAAAIAMYAAALLNQWRQVSLVQPQAPAPVDQSEGTTLANDANLAKGTPTASGVYALNLGGIICHAITCYTLLSSPTGLNLSVLVVSHLVCLAMLALVAASTLKLPVQNLNLFLYPLAIILLIATMLFGPGESTFTDVDQYLATHILISLGAYAMLMMAAFQSGLLATQEKHLRNRSFALLRLLPPLEYMEQLLIVLLWVGLTLLTAAIATGFLFLDITEQVAHHFVLTSASWVTYVAFLTGHYLFGWRGLTAVRWTTTAFIFLLLGYLGSKFVLEYLLS